MEDTQRYLTIAYLIGGLVLAWLFSKIMGLVFALPRPSIDIAVVGIDLSVIVGCVLGAGATLWLWNNERAHGFSTEVAVELSKVTWPDWEETRSSTWVVIGFTIVVSIVLALFDFFWKFATDALLSV